MQHSITRATTDHTSALDITTVVETASYSTAEPVSVSTVTPTENSQGLSPDNLVLIRENMTWNDALSYCREHHVDLVSITTELLQYRVAKRATNATSSHVWVGLRFTCSFHFWFWIRSDAGCYQNWAPGHGSDSQQDCGIAGAVETTGRQQWVSLEENQRLNFICYKCSGYSGEGLIHP
ncbi:lithostathine-1-like [Coregonus clupeaformis]|uniref:lithostathine-1-like n=1 Tax=Coregonus clupeaformis TaxID=59861 RepID=UPI001BE0552E|nr:lithostathine-1-like [Coregonus clupeaformis]